MVKEYNIGINISNNLCKDIIYMTIEDNLKIRKNVKIIYENLFVDEIFINNLDSIVNA